VWSLVQTHGEAVFTLTSTVLLICFLTLYIHRYMQYVAHPFCT